MTPGGLDRGSRHDSNDPSLDVRGLQEPRSLDLQVQPGQVELMIERRTSFLRNDHSIRLSIADLKAESLHQNVEAQHVGVERAKPVACQMFVLPDRTRDDRVLQIGHQCVELSIEASAERGLLHALEAVPIPHDIGH
jgi:hypothetical protein